MVPISGWYSIELWGASGKEGSTFRDGTGKEDKYGDYEPSISQPGRGGYTKGDIYLEAGTTLYFYIGGQGKMGTGDPDHDGHVSVQNPELGGYNGGAGHDYSWDRVAGGGGATDVRIVAASKTWDEYSSLASRIMVAGGGASNFDMRYNDVGGNAGGLVGQPGRIMGMHYGSENIDFAINDVTTGHDWTTGIYNIGHNSNPGYPYGTIPQIYAEGGKQDGGTIGNRAGMIIRYGGSSYMFGPDDNLRELGKEPNHGKSFIDSRFNGTFGKGGVDCFRGLAVGGAGGGYYGGCAGSNIHVQCNVQSAGGSSFISGYDGCLAVDYAPTEENGFKTIVHKDNSVFDYNGTEYVFTNTYMGGYDPSIEYVPITEAVTYNKKITGTYTSNPKYEDPRDYRPPQVKDNPTTDGTGIEYGHYGNGHVKITLVNTGSKDNPPLS